MPTTENATNRTSIIFDETISFIRNLYQNQDSFIPLHAPKFQGNEKKYVNECIDSTFVSSVGAYVDRFEKEICKYTGSPYAIATVNGTAALHIALKLAEVTMGDLVLTQAFSFVATCNAIKYLNADPVFIDIDRTTLGMSPESLEEFLKQSAVVQEDGYCYHKSSGRRIKACVPMHTFGHPARIVDLINICKQYNVIVVEDAAESIGSTYKGKQTGTFASLGTFSFNGNKTITSGGGGIILTSNREYAIRAKHITTQAKVAHPWNFFHDEVAYNYRLPNINAALACAQLEQLDAIIKNKRNIARRYARFFGSISIEFMDEPCEAASNFWLNAIILENLEMRNLFLKRSNDQGVMTRPAWVLLSKLPMFEDCLKADLSVSQEMEERLVNIPSSPL